MNKKSKKKNEAVNQNTHPPISSTWANFGRNMDEDEKKLTECEDVSSNIDGNPNHITGTVNNLPSYLLKPSCTNESSELFIAKDESTINLSDLETIGKSTLPVKSLSFKHDEFSARSSSLNNENQTKLGETVKFGTLPSDLVMRYQSCLDHLRYSDIAVTNIHSHQCTPPIDLSASADIPTVDLTSDSDSSDLCTEEQKKSISMIQSEKSVPVTEIAEDSVNDKEICDQFKTQESEIDHNNSSTSISEYFLKRSQNIKKLELIPSPKNNTESFTVANTFLNDTTNDAGNKKIDEFSTSYIKELLSQINLTDSPNKMVRCALNDPHSVDNTKNQKLPKSKIKADNTLKSLTNENRKQNSDGKEWFDVGPKVQSQKQSKSVSCEKNLEEPNQLSTYCNLKLEKTYRVLTNVSQDIPIEVSSKTNQWLQVNVNIINRVGNESATAYIENVKVVLKPYDSVIITLKVKSLKCIPMKFTLVVGIQNTTDNVELTDSHEIEIIFEDPKISVSNESLNFGLNAEESVKTLSLDITNKNSLFLVLELQIYQTTNTFSITLNKPRFKNMDTKIKLSIRIQPKETISVNIKMKATTLKELGAPEDAHIATLNGSIQIKLLNDKILQTIQLFGEIGFTKIQFRSPCVPFIIFPNERKEIQMRNVGVTPLDLHIIISRNAEEDNAIDEETFYIDRKQIKIAPKQIITLYLQMLNPNVKVKSPIKRVIKFKQNNGPCFILHIEGQLPPQPQNTSDIGFRTSSRNSQNTESGSINYLTDGKIPIESTRLELVWSCVPLGNSSMQNFVIRNKSENKIRIQVLISGSTCFKFLKNFNESDSTLKINLHSHESRAIVVKFCPSNIGFLKGCILFKHLESTTCDTKPKVINLYAYGGHAAVDVDEVAKDTSGRMWLSFGRCNFQDSIRKEFILRNDGTVSAFACMLIDKKVSYPLNNIHLEISPSDVIIKPGNEIKISVTYIPRREELQYIKNSVKTKIAELGVIKIVSGSQATQCRIKNLYDKLKTDKIPMMDRRLVERLNKNLEAEIDLKDIEFCKESVSAYRFLMSEFVTHELTMTVELNLNSENILETAIDDDTCLFQSLLYNETAFIGATEKHDSFISLKPSKVILKLPSEPINSVVMQSHFLDPVNFEFRGPSRNVTHLRFMPHVGLINPGQEILIAIESIHPPTRYPETYQIQLKYKEMITEFEVVVVKDE